MVCDPFVRSEEVDEVIHLQSGTWRSGGARVHVICSADKMGDREGPCRLRLKFNQAARTDQAFSDESFIQRILFLGRGSRVLVARLQLQPSCRYAAISLLTSS
jgi:hypothetical protein